MLQSAASRIAALRLIQVRLSHHECKWTTNEIRSKYLDYFCKQNKHKFIRSSSVLPKKGSGTYFTNAGMNQFKSIILGELDANEIVDPSKYIGVANSQKCIRIGGKHSDLDDIGKDTYHHTFFEMLGNWSFGAYKKELACKMALELLVDIYKINPRGLFFTYFAGDKSLNLEPDLETKSIWIKLGVKEDHVLPFAMKENFWEMDVVGPCGPCTEIHYDRLASNPNYSPDQIQSAKLLVNQGTERVIELWNLVFMQYNRINANTFTSLPSLVVDTGMGLERLSAVLNNLTSNYDTDLFMPIFDKIKSHCDARIPEYARANSELQANYRILADHMRSICVSISDGLMPSRNGLGGFLKYLILKCFKISNETFEVKNSTQLLCDLVPIVVESLRYAHPDLANKTSYIQQVISVTDERQTQKLASSTEIADRFLKKLNHPSQLNGEQMWKLFKGDGSGSEISIDFIQEYAKSKQISLDMDGFNKIFLTNNEKALRNMKNTRKDNTIFIELAGKLKKQSIESTQDSFKYKFQIDTDTNQSNYETKSFESRIVAIAVKDSSGKYNLVDKLNEGDECIIVLDKTLFYPDSGGQQSDTGSLITRNNSKIEIENVNYVQGYSFHSGRLVSKSIAKNDLVTSKVDASKRYNVAMNHTGVHLLNHAVRSHYKSENSIVQVNSIVRNESLKFEFSFNESLRQPTLDDIKSIEQICKDLVKKSLNVFISDNVKIDNLDNLSVNYPVRKLKDVLYPINLRLVSIGAEWSSFNKEVNETSSDYSAELCCGTHATNTSQLKEFVITHFNTNGDSTFEIDGLTSQAALDAIENDKKVLGYLNEMIDLSKMKSSCESSSEMNFLLHQIADRSIQIENVFKYKKCSYNVLHHVKAESVKYRPSKNLVQNTLKKYLEDELSLNLRLSKNVVVISDLNPKSRFKYKFLAFDSILNHEAILSIVKKIKDVYPLLIIYNKYRGNYILYSLTPIEESNEINDYYNFVQNKILSMNADAEMIETKPNYRVIRCPPQHGYFVF